MALTVWKVDGKTRIVLPESDWGVQVKTKLQDMGHIVQRTQEDPDVVQVSRLDAEMVRVGDLLDSTGL